MTSALKKLTYVEDEPDIRTIAEIALTQIGGFELQTCESGREALDRAPDFKPDLILLDVMMPGLDGVETYMHMRRDPALANTPIIFMTAKVQSHETAHYRRIGAIGVISKPFDPMHLSDDIRAIWEEAQGESHERHVG